MMDNAQLAKASLNDIVFEGRNKAYGAYVLRSLYNKHVTRALLIAVAFFALVVSIPTIANLLKPEEEIVEAPKNLQTVELMAPPPLDPTTPPPPPPPPPPPQAPPPPPPVVSTIKFTPPVVKRDEEVRKVEEVPDVDKLSTAAISTETVKGTTDVPPPPDLNGIEGGTGKEPVKEVIDTKVYNYVEQMPEPPGGMNALLQYIGKNIKYPAMALRNQVEGKVFVNFVVGPDGSISGVKIQKGIGAGCDEEAMRVISGLPKWTPGKQNGRNVSVSFTVPVTFAIK
ncbi:energy transducer TonB [Hymenobacter aerilatus]|uniref:Energy transducer TonB n=1 Tax=Hymenobacter aerilatus TaxID=2932251 RepID=A0A8T9SRC3_9BACT|nr:energy transducer TonB [Hymenobacter aerilatus]UOR04365.1 energy transducer TonB [Hymenobacter aerilatus]